jgi:hypothetical protein
MDEREASVRRGRDPLFAPAMAIVSKVEQVARVDFGDPGDLPLDRSIVTMGVCGTPLEALEEGVFLRPPS